MFEIIEKDLTKESTIRTPSFAKYYALVNSIEDIKQSIDFIKEKKLNIKVLGNGSNVLFSKNYYDKILFLKLGEGFRDIEFYDKYVKIGSSYSMIQAGRALINMGYPSFIFFNLIPATIGGAIRQNAGTGTDEEIKDVCISAELFDIKTLEIIHLSNKELEFNYRQSLVKKYPERYIVLSAEFNLTNKINDINSLILLMKERVKEKIDREPKGFCFGSTFVNGELSAWEYIDSIYTELNQNDNLSFSKKHKNWVINRVSTGKEVYDLIRNAQKLIKQKHGIYLKEEVDII